MVPRGMRQPPWFVPMPDESMQMFTPACGVVILYSVCGPPAPEIEGSKEHTPGCSESWSDAGQQYSEGWSDTGSTATVDNKDLTFAQHVAQALASEDLDLQGEQCCHGRARSEQRCHGSTSFERKPIYGKNFCPYCGVPRNPGHIFCPSCAFEFEP
mmetsp:Transcript_85471/g.169593  ORF Transcript_85471/g.169593 Transcript_85471/m.169593 type:complete len:156 (-) Transcript_85471:69-536(-)